MTHDLDEPWWEPGVRAVSPGVHRLALPLPLAGLPAVNCYALETAGGLLLVDPGWASDDTRGALETGLAAIGGGLGDVAAVLVTHAHWDHLTMALTLRREGSFDLLLGAGEAESIAAYREDEGLYPRHVELLRRCGAGPLGDRVRDKPPEDYERGIVYSPPDGWISDGDTMELLHGALVARSTPGHTHGHTVFDLPGGLMLTGDHVLPIASPAVGNETVPVANPLRDYMASLERLTLLPDRVMLPAHGPVGGSVHRRCRELLHHHEERLEEILLHVRSGPVSAADVASRMHWTRRALSLAELDVIHQMTAVLEVEAHLVVLEERHEVVASAQTGTRVYAG